MSGLETEELCNRIKGMQEEEQQLIVKLLPDDLLWNELHRRYLIQNTMLKGIIKTIENSETEKS